MSDDTQGDSELFPEDTETSDNTAGGESTSTEQTSDSTTEEIEEGLDLKEDQPNLSKGEQERQKQIDVWAARVASGEVTIDELPANLKWLKPRVLEKLGTPNNLSLREQIKRELAEEKDAQKFASLRDNLSTLRLSATQKKELESEFKEFKKLGLSPAKALEKAAKVTGVDLYPETSSENLRSAMRLPPLGRSSKNSGDPLATPETYKQLSESDRLKQIEELRRKNFRS